MIAIRSLRFGYTPDEPIIDDLSVDFQAARVTAVTGPSGRGKSTVLYLVGLLLTPWSGQVVLDQVDAANLADAERSRLRAREFGFVFQDAALDASRTVLDNVVEPSLYADCDRPDAVARARHLMERFGVDLRETHRPGEVSGGQAQRVGLCRALINRPRIVLADEPTGNLDHATATVVLDALADEAAAGATVIVATHDTDVIERCNDVLAL